MADPLLVEGTVHHFDILRALSGADAETVYAQSWNPPWGEYAGDSTAFVTIQMTNGVHCLYEGAKANATTMNGWGHDYLRAECERGTLELDRRKLRVLREGEGGALVAEDLPLLERPAWINAWLAEMFCDWLRGGARPAQPPRRQPPVRRAAVRRRGIGTCRPAVHVPSFLQRYLQEASG
jgi:predicted dehydrogenase